MQKPKALSVSWVISRCIDWLNQEWTIGHRQFAVNVWKYYLCLFLHVCNMQINSNKASHLLNHQQKSSAVLLTQLVLSNTLKTFAPIRLQLMSPLIYEAPFVDALLITSWRTFQRFDLLFIKEHSSLQMLVRIHRATNGLLQERVKTRRAQCSHAGQLSCHRLFAVQQICVQFYRDYTWI